MGNLDRPVVFKRLGDLWNDYSVVAVFFVLVTVCSISTPRFASWDNFMTIFRNCATVGVIALGMTFVIIAGGIDLSVGSNFAVCGVVLITLQGTYGLPLPLCLLLTCVAGCAIGLVNGVMIAKANLPPFIVTLAMMTLLRSLVMYVSKGSTLKGVKVESFTSIGNGSIPGGIPTPFALFILMAVIMHVLLNYTKFGSYIYAVGGNELAARHTGIKVDKIKISSYVLIGLLISLSSILEVSRMASVSSSVSGVGYELEAITSAIVGGTSFSGGKGKIWGTVIGAVILFIITNMLVHLNVSTYLSGAVKGLVIMSAVLLQKREKVK